MGDALEFLCNVCGKPSRAPLSKLTREDKSCAFCGSNVRIRSLLRTLSLELFHVNLPLPDFPKLKSVRGLGISDIPQYVPSLSAKFDYRNTHHDRSPRLDLMNPPPSELGQYDFVIVSDVLEHVPPPALTGIRNACALLRSGGVVIMSVPYSIEDTTTEHFPELNQFTVTELAGKPVLVNRTREGHLQSFDQLVFHIGLSPSLEVREFSERGLRELLGQAGVDEINWHGDEYKPFGVVWPEPWSVPVALRKGRQSCGSETVGELMGEFLDAIQRKNELRLLNQRRWVKLGRTLGIL